MRTAKELRSAARLMRQRAELVMTGDGPTLSRHTAEHFASWDPAVALAVADLLDDAAAWQERSPEQGPEPGNAAWHLVAVARAYLGNETL